MGNGSAANSSSSGKPLCVGNESVPFLDPHTVVPWSAVLCLVLLASLVGNGLLCFLVCRVKQLRTASNLLVGNLGAVSLLHATVNGAFALSSVVANADIARGRLWAFSMFTFHMYFSFLTLTTMFLMLLDQSLAIRYPFRYKHLKKTAVVLAAIFGNWFLSSVPVLVICGPFYRIDLNDCPALNARVAYTKEPRFQVGRYVLGPPFLLGSVALYLISKRRLKTGANRLTSELSSQRRISAQHRKALNTAFITVSTIVLSFGAALLLNVTSPSNNPRLQWFANYTVLFVPGAATPLIYFVRVQSFREIIVGIWTRACSSSLPPSGTHVDTTVQALNIHSLQVRKLPDIAAVQPDAAGGFGEPSINAVSPVPRSGSRVAWIPLNTLTTTKADSLLSQL